MMSHKSSSVNSYLVMGAITILIVASFLLILYFLRFQSLFDGSQTEWGTFGDFFGGTLNPILGFLSFIALIITINYQLEQMQQTEEELKLTRTELARAATAQQNSARILEQQLRTQKIQQFENTFFSMLNQHNLLMNDLVRTRERNEGSETNLIELLSQTFRFDTLAEAKEYLMLDTQAGQYFRVLYQLLKLIYTQDYLDNKKTYSGLVRSFLNNDILQLLAVNCYCPKGALDSFALYREIVEYFSMFEHMSFSLNCNGRNRSALLVEVINHYDKKAFGDSDYLNDLISNPYSGVSRIGEGQIFSVINIELIRKNLENLKGMWVVGNGNTYNSNMFPISRVLIGEFGNDIEFIYGGEGSISFNWKEVFGNKNRYHLISASNLFYLSLFCFTDGGICFDIAHKAEFGKKYHFFIPFDGLTADRVSVRNLVPLNQGFELIKMTN